MSLYDLLMFALMAWVLYKLARLSGIWPYPKERKPDLIDRFSDSLGDAAEKWWRGFLARRKKELEYTPSNFDYLRSGQFMLYRRFTARTLLNFKVEYQTEFMATRVDEEAFKRHRLLTDHARDVLAEEVNENAFLPYLEEKGYFFSISVPWSVDPNEIERAFRPTLYQLIKRDGEAFVREYADGSFRAELHQIVYESKGCKINLGCRLREFSDALIEENYAMLTDEQKKVILEDENFAPIEEMLAVAALKRRLDFLGRGTKQRHEADAFRVDVEKAGKALRIRWQFKERRSSGDFELLGYRRTGGFADDPYDEGKNGSLVIHATENNEIVEFLNTGEANFYTLFVRWEEDDGSMKKASAIRFQVTMPPEKEIETITKVLQEVEARKPPPDPTQEKLDHALKELGAYVEMDRAFDAMEKSFVDEIMKSDRSEEEKARKIKRLRAIVAMIRTDHEP
jgi:hypothetical protein